MIHKAKEALIPREAFEEYATDIARYNLSSLNRVGFMGMVSGILLVIASLPPLHLLSLFRGYFAIATMFTIVFALSSTVLKRNRQAVLPVYYALIVLALIVAICMGTFWGRTTNATTFVMMMVVLPMLIIDRPYRLHILCGVFSAAFCLIDVRYKTGQLLQLDIINTIVFYLFSVVLCRSTIRTKISDIIVKRELQKQRDMDSLTKLSNRGVFERTVAQYIHDTKKSAVLLIMDIDNFKQVNDTMGHVYGDMVLQLVGEYMQSAFRNGDTVSRLGGDEFVAFLPAATNGDIIVKKVEQLTRRIGEIAIESDAPCKIGASVGLAQYPKDGSSFGELYQKADEALYKAKQKGKGRCVVYRGQRDGTEA